MSDRLTNLKLVDGLQRKNITHTACLVETRKDTKVTFFSSPPQCSFIGWCSHPDGLVEYQFRDTRGNLYYLTDANKALIWGAPEFLTLTLIDDGEKITNKVLLFRPHVRKVTSD